METEENNSTIENNKVDEQPVNREIDEVERVNEFEGNIENIDETSNPIEVTEVNTTDINEIDEQPINDEAIESAVSAGEEKLEDIREIVDKCIKCGMCKSMCPVFAVMLEEINSPRGKSILLENNIYDKIIYNCTLCKACEERCALQLKLCDAFRKARQILVENKKETETNKEMIKNIRQFGNPFGQLEADRKPDKLFCC